MIDATYTLRQKNIPVCRCKGNLNCASHWSDSIAQGSLTISGYRDTKGKIIYEITGKIDDVKIYNRALNDKEIMQAMDATN